MLRAGTRGRRSWRGTARCPGVRVADKTLHRVTCIRIDATVTPAHSENELAEGNFKGSCDMRSHALSEYVEGGQRMRMT